MKSFSGIDDFAFIKSLFEKSDEIESRSTSFYFTKTVAMSP